MIFTFKRYYHKRVICKLNTDALTNLLKFAYFPSLTRFMKLLMTSLNINGKYESHSKTHFCTTINFVQKLFVIIEIQKSLHVFLGIVLISSGM